MGWRERDYARWTPDERRRFLGSSAGASASGYARGRRIGFNEGAWLAVLVSAVLLALGHLPRSNPLVPALHFTISLPHHASTTATAQPPVNTVTARRLGHIRGLRTMGLGGYLTLRGSTSDRLSGVVSIEGSYGRGWRTLATVPMRSGTYRARVQPWGRGLLHLRVIYPDGSRAVGSIRVR